MMRKRKAWLAANGGLKAEEGFKALYGPYWWLAIGEALMKLILPVEYYQVRKNGVREWDDVGWFAYQSDLGRYPDLPSDKLVVGNLFSISIARKERHWN